MDAETSIDRSFASWFAVRPMRRGAGIAVGRAGCSPPRGGRNVYDGTVVTDSEGHATVALPDWFEALNSDFRYQLTVIGQFAHAIVASEIHNNSFTIATDKPGVKVSWQVTGIRQDAWAKAHRIPVEEDRPKTEQGRYLHPELFGRGREGAIAERPKPARRPQQ